MASAQPVQPGWSPRGGPGGVKMSRCAPVAVVADDCRYGGTAVRSPSVGGWRGPATRGETAAAKPAPGRRYPVARLFGAGHVVVGQSDTVSDAVYLLQQGQQLISFCGDASVT